MKKLDSVVLPYADNAGYGFDKRRNGGRWFVSYKDGGKRCVEYNDATNEEEARAERDRRFMELLMLGAKRAKEKKTFGPIKKIIPTLGPDAYIKEVEIIVKRTDYQVIIKGQYLKTFRRKGDAQKFRDEKIHEFIVKPCHVCGKRPTLTPDKYHHWWLTHEDCENAARVHSKRVGGKARMIDNWNTVQMKAKKAL